MANIKRFRWKMYYETQNHQPNQTCKNIIESEESSNEEAVSFTRRIRNRISSNSDSDDEESYASEDLEKMLEELAIAEEEELTNADSDDEESYASEDLEKMLEELAIAEEEELTNADNENIRLVWRESFTHKSSSCKRSSTVFVFDGKLVTLGVVRVH
ncbi:hypothetical protein WN51_14266 [Melipona quadrifasciata]|uniref:Uncharacterized protein n=1 Tax=Melipona quadrifasciata TaxID=166423 RepID=A0A0N1ITM6_9HYME|nr:hypothetical protein WN51_14266 [Melipona quadrifasciata]